MDVGIRYGDGRWPDLKSTFLLRGAFSGLQSGLARRDARKTSEVRSGRQLADGDQMSVFGAIADTASRLRHVRF
jgi:hypothetical protein